MVRIYPALILVRQPSNPFSSIVKSVADDNIVSQDRNISLCRQHVASMQLSGQAVDVIISTSNFFAILKNAPLKTTDKVGDPLNVRGFDLKVFHRPILTDTIGGRLARDGELDADVLEAGRDVAVDGDSFARHAFFLYVCQLLNAKINIVLNIWARTLHKKKSLGGVAFGDVSPYLGLDRAVEERAIAGERIFV
jgi:hypothetical protein